MSSLCGIFFFEENCYSGEISNFPAQMLNSQMDTVVCSSYRFSSEIILVVCISFMLCLWKFIGLKDFFNRTVMHSIHYLVNPSGILGGR